MTRDPPGVSVTFAPARLPVPVALQLLCFFLIVLVTAVCLLVSASKSQRVTWQLIAAPYADASRADLAKFACLERQIAQMVPHGTAVFIDETDTERFQRLVELSTPRNEVVASRSEATFVLRLVPAAPSSPDCQGLRVLAQQNPPP